MPASLEQMEQNPMTRIEMPKSDLPITLENGTYFITISGGITFEHVSNDKQPASGEKIELGTAENLKHAIILRQGDKTYTFQQEADGQVVAIEKSYVFDKEEEFNIDGHKITATHITDGVVKITVDGIKIDTDSYNKQIELAGNKYTTIEAGKVAGEEKPHLILRKKLSL